MFTYVGLFRFTPIAREHLEKTPEYFDKIHTIVEDEGGSVERFLAIMGPWEYLGIFEYPDLETAFRVLGKIAKLDTFETETFRILKIESGINGVETRASIARKTPKSAAAAARNPSVCAESQPAWLPFTMA